MLIKTKAKRTINLSPRWILISLFVLNSLAAMSVTTWEKIYVKSSTDCFRCVREVPSGGYILAGYTANFSQNDTDGIIVRMNNNGDTLWTFIYNGPGNNEDLFYKVVPTSDGGFAVTGYSKSFGASDDAIYLKLDANGQLQWLQHWGGSGIEHPQDIIQLADGSYVICGYTTSSPAHYYDAFLMKTDGSGNIIFTKLYGGNNYDDANSVLVLPDGGFLMGGQSVNQFYLNRTDASGNLVWNQTFGTSGIDNIECINFAQGGNAFLLAGTTDGSGSGGEDAYLAKVDTGGNVIWSRLYGSTLNDGFHRIEQTTDGGYVAVGTSDQGSMTNPNIWLVKLDSAGNMSWQNFFGGNDHDHGYSGQQTSDGGYIVTGHTHSYISNTNNEDGLIEKTNGSGQVVNKMTWTTVTNLLSPVVSSCGSANATVQVEIANYGNTTVSNIPVTVEITGAITQTLTQTYPSSVARNTIKTLTFTTTIDMSGGGTFNFHCYTGNPHDVIPAHNYFDKSITVGGIAPPAVTPGSHCGPGTVNLSASAPTAIQWYTASSGGTSVGSGSNFTTPYLTSTTTYYAQSGGSCQSSRVPVAATISAGLSVPATTGGSRCGSGSVNLSASSANTINWYSSNSSTTILGTGTSYSTPGISTTTTYYAQADDGSCTSSRVPVVAAVLSPPANPATSPGTHCGPGTVTLTATSTNNVIWYDAASGGNVVGNGLTFTTPSISSTTTYYALADNGTCTSALVSDVASISSPPADPVTTPGSRCGTGTVQLSASSAVSVKWYNVASGGSQIGTGLTFTTPSISATTTYYAVADNGCQSNRIPAIATVNPLPASPVTTGGSRCGTGTVALSATSANTVKWFSASSGGSALATGNSFTTPSITTTTTYYAASDDGCLSTRTAAIATIHSIPANPSVTSASHCGSGAVTLSASSANTITWFDSSSAGTQLGTGTTFTTPSLTSTTTYYVSASTSNCTSNRVAVVATIASTPADPSVTSNSRCGNGTLQLSAAGSGTLKWYGAPSGGTLLGSGTSFTTPSISSTTTYYVLSDNGCLSNRVAVVATVNPVPAAPVTTSASRCGQGTVDLSATAADPIEWYASASGGSMLLTGGTFTTPSINSTTTYYASTNDGVCRSNRITAVATIHAVPADPVITDSSRCGAGVVMLVVNSNDSVNWFDSLQTQLSGGNTFSTPALTSTTPYFVQASNTFCDGNMIPVNAVINPVPVVNLGPDTILVSASSYDLDAGTGFANYLWSTSETSEMITASSAGSYCVTVTDNNSCTASDCTVLEFTVGMSNPSENIFHVYPSPTNGLIRIDHSLHNAVLTIYDLTGSIVAKRESIPMHDSFDISFLKAGCYYIRLTDGMNSYQVPVILQ